MPLDISNPNIRDLYDRKNRLAKAKERLAANTRLRPADRDLIIEFIRACERGETGKRRSNHVGELRLLKILAYLPRIAEWYGRPLEEINREAFNAMLDRLNSDEIRARGNKPYANKTKIDIKKIIIQFWRWLSKRYDNKAYFALADDNVRYAEKQPDPEAYTYEQIWNLCQGQKLKYEFLIKLFFDGGPRPSEAWNLRRKDLIKVERDNDYYYKIRIRSDTSKTVGRTISVRLCTEIIERYLQANPELEEHDFLIPYDIDATRTHLRRLGREHLKGPLTYTILRHCSMSYYAPLIKNSTRLEYRYGECTGSRAIRHYIKRSGVLDDETAQEVKADQIGIIKQQLRDAKRENLALQEKGLETGGTAARLMEENHELRARVERVELELTQLKHGLMQYLQALVESGQVQEAAHFTIEHRLLPELHRARAKQ